MNMIENKHVTIAYNGETIPKRIELGNQNENVDANIYFHIANDELKNYHKYLLASNGNYSDVLPIIDDKVKVSTALTSISGRWTLQVAFCEEEPTDLDATSVLNDRHISLSNEFVGFVNSSKYPVNGANKPMDANLQVWYENITQNMQILNDVTSTLENEVNELKNNVSKDWDINDETHGGFIKNRPIYRRTGYNLIGHEAKSGSAFSGKEGEFLTYQGIYSGQVIIGAKYRFTVDNNYVFDAVGVNEKRIEYVSGDFIGKIYDTGLTIPYYIYEETGKDSGHDFKLEVYVENEIIIEDSYIPSLQSDYSVEDETDSRYIANKIIKEGYHYEVLMKDATFEYDPTLTQYPKTIYGVVNGYSLFTSEFLKSHGDADDIYLIVFDNGVSKIEMESYHDNTNFIACYYEPNGQFYGKYGIRIDSNTKWTVTVPDFCYNERNGDVKVSIYYRLSDEKILVKKDKTPLIKPLVLDATIDYTLLPFKGDEALQAILDGRQILIKVINSGSTEYSDTDNVRNYMPVFQYQLPNHENSYLYLLYLKDGLATNLTNALGALMQGGAPNFDAVYGSIKLALSKSYTECPLK